MAHIMPGQGQLPQPQDPAELERWLLQMGEPDTQKIMQATAVLKQFIKKSACVGPMVQQLSSSNHVLARHMAAVLLRMRIHTHFKRLPAEMQLSVKTAFLTRLQQEPVATVRFGVASLISSLAKATVPAGTWPELLNFLLSMSQSQVPEHREISMILFRALTDDIGPALKPHFKTLQGIFQRGLSDAQSARVRLEALKALGALVDLLEPEDVDLVNSYRECLPALVNLLSAYFSSGQLDEVADAVTAGFELLDELADASTTGAMLAPHLASLITFMRMVVGNAGVPLSFRDHACQFLVTLLANIPDLVAGQECVPPLLNTVFALCCEPWNEAELDPTHQTPQKLGVDLLDAMAQMLPAKLVFLPCVQQGLTLTRSANPLERKGGLVIIGVIAEHLAECYLEPISPEEAQQRAAQPQAFHRPTVPELLQVVSVSVGDAVPQVREAAHLAITQFVDHLRPDILQHYQVGLCRRRACSKYR
jgi:hypothetical protein